jgi:chemotaxis protein MotB
MNTPKLFLIALGSLSMVVLSGCNSVSQRDYDAAIDENTQLRERIAGLQENVRQASEGNEAYEEQNADLRDANQRLQSQLAEAQANSRTGFEEIDGIDLGSRSGGEIVVGVGSDVLFASGSSELRKDARATLDQISQVLKSTYAGNEIRVEGYTDSDKLVKTKAKWKTNENLSAARALAVEAYLVTKGIDNNLIYSAAFGPSKGKGTKKDSRRVEIVILR